MRRRPRRGDNECNNQPSIGLAQARGGWNPEKNDSSWQWTAKGVGCRQQRDDNCTADDGESGRRKIRGGAKNGVCRGRNNPNVDGSGEGKQVLAMRAGGQQLVMGSKRWRWPATIESMIAPQGWVPTRVDGSNGTGRQPCQIRWLLPLSWRVRLMSVSSFVGEEGAENVAPREREF